MQVSARYLSFLQTAMQTKMTISIAKAKRHKVGWLAGEKLKPRLGFWVLPGHNAKSAARSTGMRPSR
jgi:hypothetical protein